MEVVFCFGLLVFGFCLVYILIPFSYNEHITLGQLKIVIKIRGLEFKLIPLIMCHMYTTQMKFEI